MGIKNTGKKDLFWNNYLLLEKELEEISWFIEFDELINGQVYSLVLAKMLLAISSEVDVVLGQLHGLFKGKKCLNIKDYREVVTESPMNKTKFIDERVCILRYGLELDPWKNWRDLKDKNPDWWEDYQSVKHHRDFNFQKATLKNVLNAMAALLISIIYLRALELFDVNPKNLEKNFPKPPNLSNQILATTEKLFSYGKFLRLKSYDPETF